MSSSGVYVVRGAIDPLLGYLSSVIRDEAQLLGGARRDAQFIKDEMESMNGFLHHLADVGRGQENDGHDQEHDHQVRAWMKQVRDLAYDTESCILLYTRRVGTASPRARGTWGHVRRLCFFLQTILVRHRAAMWMRELKDRARDIGERRHRYGVIVPTKKISELADGPGSDAANDKMTKKTGKLTGSGEPGGDAIKDEEVDASIRGLFDALPDTHTLNSKDGADELIRWLKRKEEDDRGHRPGWNHASRQPLVLAVVEEGRELVEEFYQHSSLGSLFDCKARVTIKRPAFHSEVLHDMVKELLPPQVGTLKQLEAGDDQQLLQGCVRDKRILIVVENVEHPYSWEHIKQILNSSGCSPGSAILVTTKDDEVAKKCSPDITKIHSFVPLYFKTACQMIPSKDDYHPTKEAIHCILQKCNPDLFCMKLLLHALYTDPNTTRKQLEHLYASLHSQGHIRRKMMKFSYDKLPKINKRCLLYLSIFPPGWEIRRTSIVRRWLAEGHVGEGDGKGLLVRAERCFDELVAQGFVTVIKAGSLGSVISCKVQDFVRDFIAEVVRDENFGDTDLPPNLARRLSINTGIQWKQDPRDNEHHSCQSICSCFSSAEQQGAPDDIILFLESLPAFSRARRVKVMDLDSCKGLKNHHLKFICKHLFMLKYLSLCYTEVSQLPREIQELQQLETLDIRQTKVLESATKSFELPKLKHLLAGPIDYRPYASTNQEEQLSTVWLPRNVGKMTNMEILRHVKVLQDDAELEQIKKLRFLRNLGVVIHRKQSNVNHLLQVIVDLTESLRSLSVWVIPLPQGSDGGQAVHMNLPQSSVSPPMFLETLSINGITGGLPNWIIDLSFLTEITLRDTSLSDASLQVLGKLQRLRCLRLRRNSYREKELTFKDSEFNRLEFLVIQGLDISRIIFGTNAAPKLAKIVWDFRKMDFRSDTISGISNLPSLKELRLKGETTHILRNKQWQDIPAPLLS